MTPEPLGVLAAAPADLTRNVTATQPRTVSLSSFACTARRFPICGWNPKTFWPAVTRVVARVRATGTHEGESMGMPATGKSVDVQPIDIMRFDEDGLVAGHWGVVDVLACSTSAWLCRHSGLGSPEPS
jgi:predicted ester cyclase